MYLITLKFTNIKGKKVRGKWAVTAGKREDALEAAKNLAGPLKHPNLDFTVEECLKLKPAACLGVEAA